jgi:hypothetical protein
MTNRALVQVTGIERIYMDTILYKLHSKPRKIYIQSWEELPHDGFNTRPHACYAAGIMWDAPKPKPLGGALIAKRRREYKRKRVNSIFNIGAIDVSTIFKERTPAISHGTRPATPNASADRRGSL